MKEELVLSKYPSAPPESHEQQSESFIKNIEMISMQKGNHRDKVAGPNHVKLV